MVDGGVQYNLDLVRRRMNRVCAALTLMAPRRDKCHECHASACHIIHRVQATALIGHPEILGLEAHRECNVISTCGFRSANRIS